MKKQLFLLVSLISAFTLTAQVSTTVFEAKDAFNLL
jgi:hypothetical protein